MWVNPRKLRLTEGISPFKDIVWILWSVLRSRLCWHLLLYCKSRKIFRQWPRSQSVIPGIWAWARYQHIVRAWLRLTSPSHPSFFPLFLKYGSFKTICKSRKNSMKNHCFLTQFQKLSTIWHPSLMYCFSFKSYYSVFLRRILNIPSVCQLLDTSVCRSKKWHFLTQSWHHCPSL